MDQVLGEVEVQRLLLACSHRAPTGVRNRALVALLYCSGLKLAEALALRPGDVVLPDDGTSDGRIEVGGAGGRRAHLFAAAAPYLEAWRAVRAELHPAADAPLLCTLRGAPLQPAYVRALLPRLARRAGLRRRVHAQGLRDAFAVRLAALGLALPALAEQLGHADAASTRRTLRARGVEPPSSGLATLEGLAWRLAPEPGAVRADVRLGDWGAVEEPADGGVLVRPLELDELAAPFPRDE